MRFQSTRPRGARLDIEDAFLRQCIFQSTRPRGARRGRARHDSARTYFNPRAREGRDLDEERLHYQGRISIHAPARGATSGDCPPFARVVISIHAPARGATDGPISNLTLLLISIHAPARGATSEAVAVTEQRIFQSTRPRGARRVPAAREAGQYNFNPRAREGRDQKKRTFT